MSSCSNALLNALETDLVSFRNEATPWSTSREWAATLQLEAFLKKYQEESSELADKRALEKFLAVNKYCSQWEPRWCTYEDELMGEVKNSIHQFWSGPAGLDPLVTTVNDLFRGAYAGPGASFGSVGKDFYTKFFSSHLCATSEELCTWYTACLRGDPRWLSAEDFRASHFGSYELVQGSKFCFVPKRRDISRLICVEPSLNTFFQLGFKQILESRLRRCYGIDMAIQQDRSREFARLGSLDDGPKGFVTIDLESASDSISLKMLEWLLPKDFLWWLTKLRCPRALLPDGEWVELAMISTMGNGYTFPLQTMIFSSIISGIARYRGLPLLRSRSKTLGNFSVFGDDIIITKEFLPDMMRILGHLGFTVNSEKSFVEGPFRESCGRDFFKGHDVRPVYCRKLKTQQDRYALINNLLEWSAKQGIPLPCLVQQLRSIVKYQPIPHWENVDAGIRVPSSFLDSMPRDRHTGSVKYRKSVVKPEYLVFGEDSVRSRSRRRIYNPDGAMVAFLHGSVRNGKVAIRHDSPLYQTKWAIAPSWDFGQLGVGIAPTLWRRWESVVWSALS